MSYRNDQSKKSPTAFDQASTLVTVVELSRNSWLVARVVPGTNRHPLKKLAADENGLLALLRRWQQQAMRPAIPMEKRAGHRLNSGGRQGPFFCADLELDLPSAIGVRVLHPERKYAEFSDDGLEVDWYHLLRGGRPRARDRSNGSAIISIFGHTRAGTAEPAASGILVSGTLDAQRRPSRSLLGTSAIAP